MFITSLGQSQTLHMIDLEGSWYTCRNKTSGGKVVSQQIIFLLVPLGNKPNCNNAVIQNSTKKPNRIWLFQHFSSTLKIPKFDIICVEKKCIGSLKDEKALSFHSWN